MSPSNERIALYASLTLVIIAVAGVFAYTATLDEDDPVADGATALSVDAGTEGGEATDEGGDAPADGEGATAEPTGDGDAPAGDATTTTAAPAAPTTTAAPATPAGTPDLDLSPANMEAPPEEPVGIYRQGQIILGGSVPSEDVAAAYFRRTAAILGPESIIMHMAIDPRVSGQTLRIDVDERFQFDVGSTEFDPSFTSLLQLGAVALRLLPEATLVITGHTDSTGDPATNLALSRARAQVVVDYMVQNGLPPERVVARGVGSSEPVATNDTSEGRRANRRIEASVEGITPG